MAKKMERKYSYEELSAFCLQISLLLGSAIPLDEGLSIMAEDAATESEKEMLLYISEEVELGEPFAEVLEKTEAFPPYVVRMAKLGQQTGTLDQIMESLSVYYEKENALLRSIRNAVTYPIIMVFMLLVVLFVLFIKVMPIFEDVYAQLGAQISPVSKSAIQLGGIFSGAALAVSCVLAAVVAVIWIASKFGKKFHVVESFMDSMKRKSKIALAVANRRFTSVLALTLKSGMELEKGMGLAQELVENSKVEEQIRRCGEDLEDGSSYYDAMKKTGLFSGFHIQMIKVGSRSGRLDTVMEEISKDYEQQADNAIDNMIARFEPTVVAVLAVSVGLILLSVMLPLVGVLSAIG
ncbi:type II secretion system protein F [Clostridium sp. chh4-2]|uniref:type II secretion system F family protein n=1 Tax=Clostridium sp. chh4-2 TaxID=2067550 RepID=UPI000CCE5F0B|nr:type II secretion system F family protein [Clostridium sp. chh4-2]PNV62681.1 type II secretion system protein F [Clostridium sp. chh4-2]